MATHFLSIDDPFDADDVYELALRRAGARAARFVEVGARRGRSTCYLAERILELGADIDLHVIDSGTNLCPEFSANLDRAGFLSSLKVHRARSAARTTEFPTDSLDFVFINSTIGFDHLATAIAQWWTRLRPGGLIGGCTYTDARVAAAVGDFVRDHGLTAAFRMGRSSWMIHKTLTIDATYCINLAHRRDRRQQATAQFKAAGILDRITFFDATNGRDIAHPGVISDGQAGCVASHLGVLRLARQKSYRNILIFEDDVRLAPDFLRRFETAFARCPASYDLCHLGVICNGSWGNFLHPFDDLLSRVGHAYGAHAYIVNMDRFPAIDSGLNDMRQVIDVWYAMELHSQGNCYSCTPYLAFQSPGYSDIETLYVSHPRANYDYVWR